MTWNNVTKADREQLLQSLGAARDELAKAYTRAAADADGAAVREQFLDAFDYLIDACRHWCDAGKIMFRESS
jgi:hypothetical protein